MLAGVWTLQSAESGVSGLDLVSELGYAMKKWVIFSGPEVGT